MHRQTQSQDVCTSAEAGLPLQRIAPKAKNNAVFRDIFVKPLGLLVDAGTSAVQRMLSLFDLIYVLRLIREICRGKK